MKLLTLLIGMTLGAGAVFIYHLVARPIFWQNPVDVIEVHFESAVITAFKTEQGKEAAFLIHKGARCYRMNDESSSFARIDPKDYMILNKFVICPGLGAGWVSGL